MPKRLLGLMALLGFIGSLFTALAAAPLAGCGRRLTFHDEFKGARLDAFRWNTAYGSGGNGERQFYAPDALEVRDGRLRIEARKRESHGYPYTSGIIHTQGIFGQQYGYFEIRARLPKGQGLWPAFWLLPATPNVPWEIDVFELHGHRPDHVFMAHHWLDGNGAHAKITRGYTGPDFTAGFHTFAVDWQPELIAWYVDGVERARDTEGVPAQPMFLLANLAVGGNWPGFPDETTPFPSAMEIDYVRVYQNECGGAMR
jgi:beta-glucanase (GH16 family)